MLSSPSEEEHMSRSSGSGTAPAEMLLGGFVGYLRGELAWRR